MYSTGTAPSVRVKPLLVRIAAGIHRFGAQSSKSQKA